MWVRAVHTVVFGQVYSSDGGNDDLTFTVVLPDDGDGGIDALDYSFLCDVGVGCRTFRRQDVS